MVIKSFATDVNDDIRVVVKTVSDEDYKGNLDEKIQKVLESFVKNQIQLIGEISDED